MPSSVEAQRRTFILCAVAAGSAVALGSSRQAFGATNAAMRSALKYQDTPNAGKQCDGCVQFVPGKTPKDKGGCKAIAGDDQISPTGWCAAFVAKPK